MIKPRYIRSTAYLILLILPITYFLFKYKYDNKYTLLGPQAHEGTLLLTADQLKSTPILFLRDGWEFYQYQFLSPSDFLQSPPAPTTHLFLGQYGGFELDDITASPHGTATYRLIIQNDFPPPTYTLELPNIDSSFCLYINGELVYRTGFEDFLDVGTATEHTITFAATKKTELLIAVEDHTNLYSGMQFPPAFGLPQAVNRLLDIRIVACFILAVTVSLTGIACLFFYLSIFKNKTAGVFFLLCVFFICSMGQILPRFLNLSGPWLVHLQRLCYFGTIGCMVYLQAKFATMPWRWLWVVASVSVAFCIWVIAFPLFFMQSSVQSMFFFSSTVGAYKWVCGIFLLIGGFYAAARKAPRRFLFGAYVFGCALLFDRLFPHYEPMLLFWPIQSATLINALLVFSGLVQECLRIFKEHVLALERERNLRKLDQMRKTQYQQLSQNIDVVRKIKHDMRGFLIRLNFYLQRSEYAAAQRQIQDRLGQLDSAGHFTSHPLFDAILSYYKASSKSLGIAFHIESIYLPSDLHIDDTDLTGLLTNVLQNALEATKKIPTDNPRTINLSISRTGDYLKITCANFYITSIIKREKTIQTSKSSSDFHGLGLAHIQQIVSRHQGFTEISYDDHWFSITILLPVW